VPDPSIGHTWQRSITNLVAGDDIMAGMLQEPVTLDTAAGDGATGSNRWLTLLAVALGVVMVGLDGTVVAIANPYIGASLHASLPDLQWITNSYLLVLAVLLIVGGRLGDRYGRRLVFLIGVVGFAVASAGVGLVGSIVGVIVLRGIQGAFGALLLPNTLALLRVAFPEDELNSAIGIWSSSSALAIAGAPIVGGILVEHVSWQSVFYLNIPVALITCIVGIKVLGESRETVRQRVDLAGVVVLASSLFALVFGIVKAQSWGWGDSTILGLLAGGLALLTIFVLIELRVDAPLVPPRVFKIRSVSLGVVTVMLSFFALFAVLFFVSLFMQDVQGVSAVGAGTRTLALTLSFAAMSPFAARVTTRLGIGVTISAGLGLVALALFGLAPLEPSSAYLALFPSLVALGIGLGLVVVASAEAIIGNVPVNDSGMAGGLQATAVQLGGVLGASVLGTVIASRSASVLPAKLALVGVPPATAHRLLAGAGRVSQGLSAGGAGAPPHLRRAIATASHAAFMSGFHVAVIVGGVVALIGAATGPFIRQGASDVGVAPVHV
jgi:EmrB/QacA subfamily drug resistance transporter